MANQSFFMVYLENESTPTFRHATLKGAEIEAQRLSKLHNKKSYVLCTLKSFQLTEFIVTDMRPSDDLPF